VTGVAVVTGAASGIGRATALALARDGLTVAAADLDEAGATETAEAARATGLDVHAFTVDVTDTDSVRALADGVRERLDVPWAVVNCAGWDETRPFLDTDAAFRQKVVAINLLGVMEVTHAFLGAMVERERGGRIVNVSSDAGRVGSSGETAYAGAKGGVVAFTKSVAREMARHAITANTVCPGPTDTPLFRRQPSKLQEALARAVPMRRVAQPDEVASAIAYFASESSGYVTGQVLSVSGGLTMAG